MERMGALRPLIVKNLVAAIRKDKKTRSFLVIGDPGSGKSVSLRRLYRELHKEYEKEEPEKAVVPVYINLREWNGPKIPSDEDIADYVFHYLKQWTGREGRTFLDNWYEQMLKDGGFFFILDSFDEMPPVLDCDDRSSLLKDISRAFDRFFQDLHMCRGVLASRPFRQPVGFRGRKLSIRPFREIQVREAMKTWLLGKGFDADIIVKKLFKDRPELSPAIRNPFTGELISQYVSHHNGEIPSTYYEIFESYIGKRLEEDAKYIEEQGLAQEQLLECAAVLSWEMYNNSDIGLEAELSYLQNTVERAQLVEEVYAMRDSRLIRLGGVNNQRLSFVHRRFAEYFFVKALRENHEDVKLDSIPGDSRWRDSLVVYCGVASDSEAQKIADYCWEVIQDGSQYILEGDINKAKPAIHSLRFLRDAFQSRPECISSFRKELSELVLHVLKKGDILTSKIAAETLSLLDPSDRTQGIKLAFQKKIPWISETALRACRHLSNLEKEAVHSIRGYVRTIPTLDFMKSFRDLYFSFSLSEALSTQKWKVLLDLLSILCLWAVFVTILFGINIFSGIVFYFGGLLTSLQSLPSKLKSKALKKITNIIGEIFRPGMESGLRVGFFYFLFSLIFILDSKFDLINHLNGPLRPFIEENSYWIIVMFLFIIPWELWTHLPILISWIIKNFLITIKIFLVAIGSFICCFCIMVPFVLVFVVLLRQIEFFKDYEQLIMIDILLFSMLLKFINWQYRIIKDKKYLSKLQIPDIVSRNWIFTICDLLHTSLTRTMFMENLRIRKVAVTNEMLTLPDFDWVNRAFQEQYARLEEQWHGLDE
ncbi:MAG: NACHT domain-containing protein [Desulfobacterales bacterium]|nr:NACHT domain-containing protein [Desulfobacterales bacterium]